MLLRYTVHSKTAVFIEVSICLLMCKQIFFFFSFQIRANIIYYFFSSVAYYNKKLYWWDQSFHFLNTKH